MRSSFAIVLSLTLVVACPAQTDTDPWPSCEALGCGGVSVCIDGACRPRACLEVECDPGFVCQPGPECRIASEDRDGDGSTARLDCDDDDPLRIPGNSDLCDGIDNDCDGVSDDGAPCRDGQRCCGEAGCQELATSRDHCGGCGNACELYDECVAGVCEESGAPVLIGVSPDPLPTGEWLEIVLAGEHLVGYATVFIEAEGGSAAPFEVVGREDGVYFTDQPVQLDGERLPAGEAELWVERNDGLLSNRLPVLIQGAARPTITSFSPNPFPLAQETGASANGTGFWGDARLLVRPDDPAEEWRDLPLRWIDSTWLRSETLVLDPADNPPGDWVAIARNPDGLESDPYSFVVEAAAGPTLTSLTPLEGQLATIVALEVYGFDMFATPSLLLAPERAPAAVVGPLPIDLFDPGRIRSLPFELAPEIFTADRYLVWVENPDGTESNRLAFSVIE